MARFVPSGQAGCTANWEWPDVVVFGAVFCVCPLALLFSLSSFNVRTTVESAGRT